jgi:hypothetical protein
VPLGPTYGRPVRRSSWVGARVLTTLALLPTLLVGATSASADETSARGTITSSAPYVMPLEPYAGYQPQTRCMRKAKPGVLMLADWLVARGGGYGAIFRVCAGSSTSEHKESRAFDWVLDATSETDQALAAALLDELLAPDDTGEPNALARRMGIMYVIWDDTMYASYDEFVAKRYLSSGCRNRRTCSPTLRHRDHLHISLTRQGAKGLTSWYAAQQPLVVAPPT